MTRQELAIARSVLYAALFDYPLTLEQLYRSLIESDQTAAQILATYDQSDSLQRIIQYRDGFFFPSGRGDLAAERRRREARSRAFLDRHRSVLRWICALPYTRMVALSGSIAHLNLEPGGDLDLFIVTRGRRVWTVTLAVLVLTKLVGRRRVVCANFVLADSHLALDQQDLFTANQVIHLKPLVGDDVLDALLAANPFVGHCYPNAVPRRRATAEDAEAHSVGMFSSTSSAAWIKRALEVLLLLPSPLIEAACRGLYGWHLRRRAGAWRSPDQVKLQADYLKLHTHSHRRSILERFERSVRRAIEDADVERSGEPPVAVAGPPQTRVHVRR